MTLRLIIVLCFVHSYIFVLYLKFIKINCYALYIAMQALDFLFYNALLSPS